MTIAEAVEILKKGYTPRGDREAFKQYFFARKMAIRSLEAWGKLRSEIMAIGKWRKKSEISNTGIKDCLAIIDRHIAEIRG